MAVDREVEARGVMALAVEIFEDRTLALDWMATPNATLGGLSPRDLCGTQAGAQQVRRVLRALESGGAA